MYNLRTLTTSYSQDRGQYNDPYLYRFAQPDSIIPDLTSPQAWNRYSYVENRPIVLNDPTGQTSACGFSYSDPDCPKPPSESSPLPPSEPSIPPDPTTNSDNGDGGDSTWENINEFAYWLAETYLPANAKGSHWDLAFLFAPIPVLLGNLDIYIDISIITSSDGMIMFYFTTGDASLSSPQISIAISSGPIFGKGFDSPEDFRGDSYILFGGVSVTGILSGNADIWSASVADGKSLPEVWGYDGGLSLGGSLPPQGSGGLVLAHSEPISGVLQIPSIGFLICRIVYQCGRTIIP